MFKNLLKQHRAFQTTNKTSWIMCDEIPKNLKHRNHSTVNTPKKPIWYDLEQALFVGHGLNPV